MRILLDECIDQRFRYSLPEHDCQSAGYAGLSGLKNGALLLAAEEAGFEILFTVDQNIPAQQAFDNRQISLVILRGQTNRLRDLTPLVPNLRNALRSLAPGRTAVVRGE